MKKRVLILGGQGRIGSRVAQDLIQHTEAEISVTGRSIRTTHQLSNFNIKFLALDLNNQPQLRLAISSADLVIHCAGPFHDRDGNILKCCIEEGVNYIDVSDSRSFTQKVLSDHHLAQNNGVTAVINTGIFPGISNSLARLGVEKFDTVETIQLHSVVGGSGGAGMGVMRTTFLGLKHPFKVWIEGKWQQVKPYSNREVIDFPAPYGKIGVYWFDLPECYTLAQSFPVKTVMTKFGSFPDFYNTLTGIVADKFPSSWLQNSLWIEFLSQVSYRLTHLTDRWSGTGVVVQALVTGHKTGKKRHFRSRVMYENTAKVAGMGCGSIAELILTNQLSQPGVWPVEQILPTSLFQQAMHQRNLKIQAEYLS